MSKMSAAQKKPFIGAFNIMANRLHSLGIVHDNMHESHFLCDEVTGKVNPINMGSSYSQLQLRQAEAFINHDNEGTGQRVVIVRDTSEPSNARLNWVVADHCG